LCPSSLVIKIGLLFVRFSHWFLVLFYVWQICYKNSLSYGFKTSNAHVLTPVPSNFLANSRVKRTFAKQAELNAPNAEYLRCSKFVSSQWICPRLNHDDVTVMIRASGAPLNINLCSVGTRHKRLRNSIKAICVISIEILNKELGKNLDHYYSIFKT